MLYLFNFLRKKDLLLEVIHYILFRIKLICVITEIKREGLINGGYFFGYFTPDGKPSRGKLIINNTPNFFWLNANLELDITEENQIILDAKNINLNITYYLITEHRIGDNNIKLLPFVITNSNNSNITINSNQKTYGNSPD